MNDRTFRNWLKRNNPHIAPGDSDELQHVLNGSTLSIGGALQWGDSPQGWIFWHDAAEGRKLSKRTRQFISKLRDEARRRGY